MLLVHYPKCSTCQNARKWLLDKGFEFSERDIKLENPSKEELKHWYVKSNLDIKKFFNTSGLLYKELQLKDKLLSMTEEEKIELLSTNGMLVKRPILVTDTQILVGFKEKSWLEALKL